MDCRVVITGAAGFIGKNIINYLVSKIDNIKIIGIDILPSQLNCSKYKHFQLDVRESHKFSFKLLEFRPHWIIHLAAVADLKTSNITDLSVNWLPVETLKYVQNSLHDCKLVYFSSMLAKESIAVTPDKVYGHSKFLMEQKCLDTENKNFIVLRPSTVWGIYHESWINEFVKASKYRYVFKIKNINPKRYFCYVENVSAYIHELILFGIPENRKSQVFFLTDPPVKLHDYINTFTSVVFGYKTLSIPYFFMYIIAKVGDTLANLKIRFSLTSFRLSNMSTDMSLPENKIIMCKKQCRLNLEDSCHDFKIKKTFV